MARTNSRKIQRRGLRKRSPLPAIFVILWIAALCMTFVYLHMSSSTLDYELKGKKADVAEAQNRVRNLTAEVEKLTTRKHILQKVEHFKLKLKDPIPGQVFHVRHIEKSDGLPVQKLRDDLDSETVASRR